MKRNHLKGIALAVALILILALAGCGESDPTTTTTTTTAYDRTTSATTQETDSSDSDTTEVVADGTLSDPVDVAYSDRDLSGAYYDSVESITLDGASVTITEPGTYILSGTIDDGQVIVDATAEDKIQLVLDGVAITCSDGPALYVLQADKVFVTLADGSDNTLTDGTAYAAEAEEDGADACIFSHDDLTLNGSGSLTVTGNYNHGIHSKDDLILTGGDITITAVNDGLKGKDCVQIADGTLNIVAGGDGIQSSNDTDEGRGYVSIDGGSITITSELDGIQAATVLQVYAGTLDITSGGGSENASTRSDWGTWGDPRATTTTTDTGDSAKALKAATLLLIEDGDLVLDSSDDALHADGDIHIAGGSIEIASGDDGGHADDVLLVSGGDLTISKSYEGLEASNITLSGGTIDITASDDGLNAAGGNDGSALGMRPGRDNFAADSSIFLRISGGTLTVNASGDGIDSNGNLYVEGGTILVSGPTSNGDGALDYNGTATITGGILVAAGSTGMAEGFQETSTQYSFLCALSSGISGGTTLTVRDASGQELLSYTPDKDYQSVVFSAPDLAGGETYTVEAGNQSLSITLTSIATSSGLSGMGGAPMAPRH